MDKRSNCMLAITFGMLGVASATFSRAADDQCPCGQFETDLAEITRSLSNQTRGSNRSLCLHSVRLQKKSPGSARGSSWAFAAGDVAGKLLDGSMLYGECKWWKDLVGENILDELIERASRTDYGRDNHKRQFVLYARTGFTTTLQRRAAAQPGIALHTPQTMLRAPGTRTRSPKRPARSRR
jgi:hypothetical protein